MFPYLAADDYVDDDGGIAGDAPFVEGGEVRIDATHILYLPGLLHVLSNASKDLLLMTVSFADVYAHMEAITLWLNDKQTREHFVATCLANPPHSRLKPLFESFPHTLIGWRWQAVWETSQALLNLKDALCCSWSAERMSGRFRDGDVAAAGVPLQYNGHGVRLRKATDAVRSQYMWSYLEMLVLVGDKVQHMCHWAESCPCHGFHSCGVAGSWRAARKLFEARYGHPDAPKCCPVAGCRVSEVCAGDFSRLVNSIQEMGHMYLLLKLTAASAADRAIIFADYDRIRTYLFGTLHAKLRAFLVLPRLLIGLAHFDDSCARAVGRRALRQWGYLLHRRPLGGDGSPEAAHAVSKKFLREGSPLRAQLEHVVEGEPIEALPLLHSAVALFARASTTERSIESKHAKMNREYQHAPNLSPPVVSLSHRLPEMSARMREDPHVLEQLAEHVSTAYHSINIVRCLGLDQHPICQAALQWHGEETL